MAAVSCPKQCSPGTPISSQKSPFLSLSLHTPLSSSLLATESAERHGTHTQRTSPVRGSLGASFTQPRAHLIALPCGGMLVRCQMWRLVRNMSFTFKSDRIDAGNAAGNRIQLFLRSLLVTHASAILYVCVCVYVRRAFGVYPLSLLSAISPPLWRGVANKRPYGADKKSPSLRSQRKETDEAPTSP